MSFFKNGIGSDSKNPLSDHRCSATATVRFLIKTTMICSISNGSAGCGELAIFQRDWRKEYFTDEMLISVDASWLNDFGGFCTLPHGNRSSLTSELISCAVQCSKIRKK